MPLYEYECENGHRFEIIQKFADPPLERCTRCGAPARKRQSAPAFQFKGSGWYITDYARKDQSAGSNGSGSSSDSAKSGSTKSGNTETAATAGKDSAKAADSAPASGSVKTE